MLLLLFSGVGAVSASTARLVNQIVSDTARYEQVKERLALKHGIDLAAAWARLADYDESNSRALSALDQVLIQFAVQIAGAEIALRAVGADAEIVVLGHSVGELAAAVVAGHLGLDEAVDAAVQIAAVTSKLSGDLWYGSLAPGDVVASVNHGDDDGTTYGAIATRAREPPREGLRRIHTGFPWHHPDYKAFVDGDSEARSEAGSPPVEAKCKPLALSLVGGLANQEKGALGAAYWAKWAFTGVNLAGALVAVRNAFPIDCVVEISAHPMLLGSARSSFSSSCKDYIGLFNRETGLDQDARQALVKRGGEGLLQAILRTLGPTLNPDKTWAENGLNSADLVLACQKLRRSGTVPLLKPHHLFRMVSPRALALATEAEELSPQAESKATAQRTVVVQAMSCLLPGNLRSAAQLAGFAATQGDAVRRDTGFDTGKHAAGFLGDICIDLAKFGLSRSEAATLDPQQALVLECVDKLLEENGIMQLPASTGVYIGAWNSEFAGDRSSVFYPTGTNPSLVAARVSHIYKLHGPCKVINSACASSLEAVLEAFRDVSSGKVECALAGGVNLLWDPHFTECMAQSGFLGPTQRCRSFDACADGYVRSEGCGLVLLARKGALSPQYHCEILGGASNQNGGRSASITAPSPVAQEECIRMALADAGLSPADVDYVECHGTGTKLGDPIEWAALARTIGAHRTAARPCLVASIKSNIGHLESAAGVAGLIHAATVLSSKVVPRPGNLSKPNPFLDACEGLKLAFPANVAAPHLAVAGVSSFGFGGSNVHLVLRASPNVPLPQPPMLASSSADSVFVFDRSQPRVAPVLLPVAPEQQGKSPAPSAEAKAAGITVEATLWEVVHAVAGEVTPADAILRSGLDSLGLTELFLRIEQRLGVDAAHLSEFLAGEHSWGDLRERVLRTASPVQQQSAAATPPKQQQLQQTAASPPTEVEDEGGCGHFTWAQPRFNEAIRTTHVGSLPRSSDKDEQYKELHSLLQKQLSIGLTYINDGEVGRIDYATAVLTRMTGFEEQAASAAPQPQDLEDMPCVARRFLRRAGLITLNKSVLAANSHCVGAVKYIGENSLKRELEAVRRALALNNAGLPGQAFWTAPSPGTLAMFFQNDAVDEYPSYDDYLEALGAALRCEYAAIVRNGFVLQVDCPDLAMSRHTRFKHLGLSAWKAVVAKHVAVLNRALEGLPRASVRVHVCWGNYAGTHHRDAAAADVLSAAFTINAGGIGFEAANPRHAADWSSMQACDIPHDVVLYPGVVDTCSMSVESPAVVCERICRFAKLVGPSRVVANTDCGFSTTAQAQGLPGEVAWMKLRALVAGARMATHAMFPKAFPAFVPRPSERRFLFCAGPLEAQRICDGKLSSRAFDLGETRVVFTSLREPGDAAAVAQHVRLFVDTPVSFDTDGSESAEAFAGEVRSLLANGSRCSPAFPCEAPLRALEPSDMVVGSGCETALREAYDVVVVGAGVVGLLAAKHLAANGVDVVVLEKESFVGGIWTTFANPTSQVNSSEGSYRLNDTYRKRPNRDHSTTAEVRADILEIARDLLANGRLFTQTAVTFVERSGPDQTDYTVTLASGSNTVRCRGVILAINDRVGQPRPVKWPGQGVFQGTVVDGFGGDARAHKVDWAGKRVVIVGMGAFAVENARTALEAGARNVVVVARRHGTVCPKYIDYINFVHRDSVGANGRDMDTSHNSKNMFLWRKLYDASHCTMPECWLGLIKHTGHTISVSDVWFVGHHLGLLETRQGDLERLVENGVVLAGSGELIQADVVVRCTGFERNASAVPTLTPYRSMTPVNYLDTNLMYLADAFIDDDAFNSFFGSSVVEMAKFFVMVFEHFFKGRDLDALAHPALAALVDVQDRKWTDYIRGAEHLVNAVPDIRLKADALLRRRYRDFVEAQSVEEYIAANKREWVELHDLLTQGTVEQSCMLPYPSWAK